MFGCGQADRLRTLIAAIREFARSAAVEVKRKTAAIQVAAGWVGSLRFEKHKVVKHKEWLLSLL
jgi:hypothetical protein